MNTKNDTSAFEAERIDSQQPFNEAVETTNETNNFETAAEEVDDEEDGDELYEHFNIIVDKGQTMMRVDKFLTLRMERRSRSKIQAAIDSGSVLVNKKAVKSSYKVKPLDEISIVMPYPRRELDILAQDIPIDIVYEDDNLLVVNKEAGMVVHPGFGNYEGTLVNALTFHLQSLPLFQENNMRAGLVHRIDKNTSGLIVVAKDEYTHAALAKQFFDHTIERTYNALVWGDMESDSGTIVGNIGRSVKNRLQMAVFPEGSTKGKHAVTHYKVLERFGYVTLVECKLETGRTHQIRTHFLHIGHPLFNDERYGGDRVLRGTTFTKYKQFVDNCFKLLPRHALHALSLGFEHPITKEHIALQNEYTTDFSSCLEKWREYKRNVLNTGARE